MDRPTPDDTSVDLGPQPDGPTSRWALAAFGGVAALILVIGFVVWIASRDSELVTSSPPTTAPAPTASAAPTTEPPATTAAVEATVPPATTAPAATTAPETTTTVAAGPEGASWTVTSAYLPEPLTLERVAEADGIAAYDGQLNIGDVPTRCVAIVIDGSNGWQEWCGPASTAAQFIAFDGVNPWLVELGAAHGAVTFTAQDPTWTLQTNGCTSAVSTLVTTAGLRAQVPTGLVCAGNEAFLRFAPVLLQDGGPDGGGVLLAEGDEGWSVLDGGTSIGCAASTDGIDRCALFDVESELFEAVLPIPPASMLPTNPNIVEVRDETATVRGWIGNETDRAAIEAIVAQQLVDPDAEVVATTQTAAGLDGGRIALMMVEIPAFDDSILSTTWAVWITDGGDGSRPPVVRVTAWQTCARGGSSGQCV